MSLLYSVPACQASGKCPETSTDFALKPAHLPPILHSGTTVPGKAASQSSVSTWNGVNKSARDLRCGVLVDIWKRRQGLFKPAEAACSVRPCSISAIWNCWYRRHRENVVCSPGGGGGPIKGVRTPPDAAMSGSSCADDVSTSYNCPWRCS